MGGQAAPTRDPAVTGPQLGPGCKASHQKGGPVLTESRRCAKRNEVQGPLWALVVGPDAQFCDPLSCS